MHARPSASYTQRGRTTIVAWVSVPKYTLSGKVQFAVTNPVNTRRGFWTFAALTWALAMLSGVIGVGLYLHQSLGGFVFAACLLTLAVAFWLWIHRRLIR